MHYANHANKILFESGSPTLNDMVIDTKNMTQNHLLYSFIIDEYVFKEILAKRTQKTLIIFEYVNFYVNVCEINWWNTIKCIRSKCSGIKYTFLFLFTKTQATFISQHAEWKFLYTANRRMHQIINSIQRTQLSTIIA